MTAQPSCADRDDTPTDDHIIQLRGVTWADYERLLAIRGDPKAAERPHLAIEVVGIAGRIDKLAIYPLRHRHRVGPGRGPRSWGHALSAWNRASAATVGIRLFH